ncbi:Ferric oxidoreductase domain-containing protein [Fusarium falciforme]|uniref:Ferric oxidoreductase domain-containing protein n=1 Tax=Fusarium falciforme TaxID=195108 RepID=UPI0022FFEE18|nr:Ferric oxidoreductase domain-containing protein [Fusarium falciforme]WAO87726.1 Ferric oxidoreductase domain-containing protein [Fusarium falciforme]
MLLSNALAAAALLLPAAVSATELLDGYGRESFSLPCGWGCRYAMPSNLDCPEYAGMTPEEKAEQYPSAACMANDTSYLTSFAWCINSYCPKTIKSYKILKFWETDMIYGQEEPGVVLRYSYADALKLVDPKKPPKPMNATIETVFNRTISISPEEYEANMNGVKGYKAVGKNESTYSLLVFLSGVVMPVGFSLLRLLPFPAKLRSRFYAFFIDPPAWGRKHSVPVLGLGFIPTRGQMIFITYLIGINLAACFAGFPRYSPNAIFPDRRYELMRHMGNRAGAIAFANIPLVILYGGRNSLLLWMTNWSHSTFLLLHRWVATICTLQVCLHSLLWLRIMVEAGSHSLASKQPYWYWGIIGTLSFSLLIPLSVYHFRKIAYEVFLIGHIFLAIMAIVGSWYHIWKLYEGTGGFDIWLYIAISIWSFDRFLRIVRVSKHGIKRAYVTRIDDEYIRVDVPGVDCHGYCYAYFPTVSWRMWENHPFSVVGCNPGHPRNDPHSTSHSDSEGPSLSSPTSVTDAAAKESGIVQRTRTIATRNGQHGITFFVRPHSGLTKLLAKKCGVEAGIPVLIEGTYGHEGKTYLQGNDGHFAPTPEYPNILCIAGGVGVTAVLPALNSSLSLYAPMGTTKLYWGIRGRGLVDSIQSMMMGVGEVTDTKWGHIEPHITVGSRMNVRQILEEELEHAVGGTTVVACGPLAMVDDVRYTCAALARHGTVVRYIEEACTW